jgi:hypothetical protein
MFNGNNLFPKRIVSNNGVRVGRMKSAESYKVQVRFYLLMN